MIVIVLELMASIVCLYLMGKRVFHFFHFTKKAFFLTLAYSFVYFLALYLTKDTYLGEEAFGKFTKQISAPVVLLFTLYPIIIAFSEELIFRLYLSEKSNMMIAAIIFTALHWRPDFPLLMFGAVFLFALAQSSLLKNSKSLWPIVITHLVATYSLLLIYG